MNWIKNNINSIGRYFYITLSIVSTILGIIFMFLDLSDLNISIKISLLIISLILILLISLLANWIVSKKITIKISKNTNLNIFYGNIFDGKENIVIPVSEYFDMVVDEKYVSSKTLHGQFVNSIFSSNISELEEKIKASLAKEKGTLDKKRNKKKYQIGTTAIIEKNGIRYFLVVLTKFNDKNKVYCNVEDYFSTIQKLLIYLHNYSQGGSIFLPLIGGGLSNVNMSKIDLIHSLIISMKSNPEFSAIGEVNLVLPKALKGEINLSDIKYCHK